MNVIGTDSFFKPTPVSAASPQQTEGRVIAWCTEQKCTPWASIGCQNVITSSTKLLVVQCTCQKDLCYEWFWCYPHDALSIAKTEIIEWLSYGEYWPSVRWGAKRRSRDDQQQKGHDCVEGKLKHIIEDILQKRFDSYHYPC